MSAGEDCGVVVDQARRASGSDSPVADSWHTSILGGSGKAGDDYAIVKPWVKRRSPEFVPHILAFILRSTYDYVRGGSKCREITQSRWRNQWLKAHMEHCQQIHPVETNRGSTDLWTLASNSRDKTSSCTVLKIKPKGCVCTRIDFEVANDSPRS